MKKNKHIELVRHRKINALDPYPGRPCSLCGRLYPETTLNIEGHIHHNEPYRCIDTKKCNKVRLKNKYKK